MFKKIKKFFSRTKSHDSNAGKPRMYFHPYYNQSINYNPDIDKSNSLKKLEAWNKKGDEQLEKLQRADKDFSEGNIEKSLKVYNKIVIEDGLVIDSQGHCMSYLKKLYKLERYDEAWDIINQYAFQYPSLEGKCQEFRVKVLKKKKLYKDALYHQVLAIIFKNIHFHMYPEESYKNKYIMILKRIDQEDKAIEVQGLINKYTEILRYKQLEIRDDLLEIINEKR